MVNLGLLVAIVTMVVGSIVLDSLSAGAQTVAEPLLLLVPGCRARRGRRAVMLAVGHGARPRVPALAVAPVRAGLVLALVVEAWSRPSPGPCRWCWTCCRRRCSSASGVGLLGIASPLQTSARPA